MAKRSASAFIVLLLVSLITFAADSQLKAPRQSKSITNRISSQAAHAKKAQIKNPTAPPTNIGFLSAPRMVTGGSIAGTFPAAMGDFAGNGIQDAVTIVNTGNPLYNIAAEMNDGTGNFTTVLTPTGDSEQDSVFVADLNGDGKDDVLLVHAAVNPGMTTIQSWISNGDGTFTANSSGPFAVTTNGFVWAAVTDVNGDGKPDVVVADAATPNGNIWTLLGNGDGTFQPATSVPFTGALNPFPAGFPPSVQGNPIVFADLNGDGSLDFAGPAASNNQIMVYLCSNGTNPCASYAAPVALTTTDGNYDSTFLAGGDLTGDGKDELVSANDLDGSITVYVNNGSGSFPQGVYYPTASATTVVLPNPVAVAIADVNGDNKNDILATDYNSAAVWLLTGNGDGTVNYSTVGYATGGSPLNPALVADFNGDGNADVLIPDNQLNFMFLAGYGDGSFRSATNYYAENVQGHRNGFHAEGVGLASGDFNGDGIPDFVIGTGNGNLNTTGITVFLSNPDGSLQTGVNYFAVPNNASLQYVAVADFNNDGILDIAASDNFNGVVQIFYGVGDGTFTTGPTYPIGAGNCSAAACPVGIVTADFNGDGKPDLAVINNNSATNPTTANVAVLINNGSGFNAVANYSLSNVATELTAADINGDGKLDLVVPLYGVCPPGSCSNPGSAVAILIGNGDGTFKPESDVSLVNGTNTYYNPYDAAVGDLNGDGKADLAVTIQDQKTGNQGIAVALGNGDGTFKAPTLYSSSAQTPPLPGYVKIADMNRDGYPDLVYTNALSGTVGIMYGVGDGTFHSPLEFAAARWAWDFALVDVNGDTALDVVTSGFEQSFDGVGVLLNTSGGSIPVPVSSANPSQAGAPITITATVASKVRGVTAVPTGNVTFFDGPTSLGSAALNSSGQASLTTGLPAGSSHSITAQYGGDTNYVPVTSSALNQVVNESPDTTGLMSSANPAFPGQSVTFTATVASTVSGDSLVPTGTVTFSDGGTALGAAVPLTSGVATSTTSSLAAGSHSITAQYSGDTNFPASISAAVKQVVAVPDYSLAATPGSQSVNPGSAATYTITVTPANGYNGTISFPASACSGLPSGATCSFSASSLPGSGNTTLTISTTGPTGSLITPADLNPRSGRLTLMASLTGFGLISIVLAGDVKKHNRRRGAFMLLGILALVLILGIVGCGGGSTGGGGGGGGTPAGTYAIQVSVTGTAGTNGGSTAQHSLTTSLTLVVQ